MLACMATVLSWLTRVSDLVLAFVLYLLSHVQLTCSLIMIYAVSMLSQPLPPLS